ncbi:sulfite exporter TauE/SafE family protein [Oceanospirillum sanctuarii]|uniref:sulfite exporter TauE/SafE family protein n=1 Tax=Oceanospirillum sanctuarii TaxID=1434821 RepID=UPI001FE923E7|nr:sulfite exporter TauE/SafE family protein [Oceanospirillum sanctuarii]
MSVLWITLAAVVTGFSKFSTGGMGILILPLMMLAFPGPEALGVIIPLYVITDLMAIARYRKGVDRKVLLNLMPLAMLGIVLGGWLLANTSAEQFTGMLALLIIAMLGLSIWLEYHPAKWMRYPFVGQGVGLFSGFISTIGNAAGPFLSLYLMEQKLDKAGCVATRAWAFTAINLAKVPVLISIGLLNSETFQAGLIGIPGLFVGAVIGAWVMQKMNLSQFRWLIRGMALLAVVNLLAFR